VAAAGFTESAAVVKAELKRLETELQRADARGDRRTALTLLSRMLDLQRRFMDRWSSPARTTPPPATGPAGRGDDEQKPVTPPGRSGSNPDNV
jgi:hypothetical protein